MFAEYFQLNPFITGKYKFKKPTFICVGYVHGIKIFVDVDVVFPKTIAGGAFTKFVFVHISDVVVVVDDDPPPPVPG